jgi:hypothetical protein
MTNCGRAVFVGCTVDLATGLATTDFGGDIELPA